MANLYEFPLVPEIAPAFGSRKLFEEESDYRYLQYLYPMAVKDIVPLIEDRADQMEYEGSPMFDEYPDRQYFRNIAREIYERWKEKNPETDEKINVLFRDLIEVLLFHEIMYRRNRYRSRKRLFI